MTHAGRITRLLVALTAIIALFVTGAPASVSAADTGTVEGRVTTLDGAPVLSAQVHLRSTETDATTSAWIYSDGRFTARWLAPGDYIVWVDSQNNTRPEQYTQRWYPGADDAAGATPVTVTAGATTEASWRVGAAGPGITGIVSDALTGAPIPSVRVEIDGPVSHPLTWTDTAGRYRFSTLPVGTYEVRAFVEAGSQPLSHAGSTKIVEVTEGFTEWNPALAPTGGLHVVTDQTGLDSARAELYPVGSSWPIPVNRVDDTITATGLIPGDYELLLSPRTRTHDFVSAWWPDGEERDEALPITVRSGETTRLTWELTLGARVSGRVTSEGTDTTPAGGSVTATDARGRTAGSSIVDADGRYVISSLRAGTYALTARGDDHTTKEAVVSVSLGDDAARDFALQRRGTIAVTVTTPAGAPRAEIVSVYDDEFHRVSTTRLSPDGANATAEITGLDADDYFLTIQAPEGTLFGWYGGATTFSAAKPIAVRPGKTTTVTFPATAPTTRTSGSIALALHGPQGEGVDSAIIEVFDADGLSRRVAQADVDKVALNGLPPGEYRLRFQDAGSRDRHPFAETWWGGKSLADATRVRVSAGKTTTISATMKRSLPADSATIVGTLAAAVPALTAGTRVHAWRSTTGSPHLAGTGLADARGRFVIPGLLPGKYLLQVEDDPRWQDRRSTLFLPDAAQWTEATAYTVSSGQTLRVDPAPHDRLAAAYIAEARGAVRVGAKPAAGVEVRLSNGTWTAFATTDADGFFERDLPSSGSITVEIAETSKTAKLVKNMTSSRGRLTSVDLALTPKINTTRPTLPSTAKVGASVTATVSGWTSGATLSYQWRRDGKAIKGATGHSYRPSSSDRGKKLTVSVTGRKSGYAAVTRTSESRVVGSGTLTTSRPSISGNRTVGKTLTAVRGTWSTGVTYSYQWYANGSKIAGATKRTYTLTRREARDTITVKVTGRKAGYTTVTRTSPSTRRISG